MAKIKYDVKFFSFLIIAYLTVISLLNIIVGYSFRDIMYSLISNIPVLIIVVFVILFINKCTYGQKAFFVFLATFVTKIFVYQTRLVELISVTYTNNLQTLLYSSLIASIFMALIFIILIMFFSKK